MANDTNSVDALLQAAQFLEAANDGDDAQSKGRYKRPPSYCRSTHNILEKNRRAQLRDCLEVLRENVPFSDKMTTLSLLQSARRYIVILKRQKDEQDVCKQQLLKQNDSLSHRLVELGGPVCVTTSNQHLVEPLQEVFVEAMEPGPKRIHLEPTAILEECETEVIIDVDSNVSDCEESGSCSGSDGGISNNSIKWPMQEVVITTSSNPEDDQNVEILTVS
jgi:hypothetical protein